MPLIRTWQTAGIGEVIMSLFENKQQQKKKKKKKKKKKTLLYSEYYEISFRVAWTPAL